MKRNGFTLVELLAIIVILALLAIIASPIIMNIIANSKKSAFASSVNGIKNAIENDYGVRDFESGNHYDYINGVLYFVDAEGKKTVVPMSGGVSSGNGIATIDGNGNIILRIYTSDYCGTFGVSDQRGISVSTCNDAESCKRTCGIE